MIMLYTFGPGFGLPDPSPFVGKAEILLKMSGLDYQTDTTGFSKAPKGKLPYMRDGETVVADSTFIRQHLEQVHNIDFEPGLTSDQKAWLWGLEKFCEDHLYWLIIHDRWVRDECFERGPKMFFDAVPAPLRPLIIWQVRGGVKKALWQQGTSRHTDDERQHLADQAFETLSSALGDKDFLMGAEPCGADACVWSFVASVCCEHFDTPMVAAALRHENLKAYRDRGLKLWYADFVAS